MSRITDAFAPKPSYPDTRWVGMKQTVEQVRQIQKLLGLPPSTGGVDTFRKIFERAFGETPEVFFSHLRCESCDSTDLGILVEEKQLYKATANSAGAPICGEELWQRRNMKKTLTCLSCGETQSTRVP